MQQLRVITVGVITPAGRLKREGKNVPTRCRPLSVSDVGLDRKIRPMVSVIRHVAISSNTSFRIVEHCIICQMDGPLEVPGSYIRTALGNSGSLQLMIQG